jgi:competence protein ComEC
MKDYPLIKFVVLFITGIIAAKYFLNFAVLYTISAAVILPALYMVFITKNKSFLSAYITSALLYVIAFTAGAGIYLNYNSGRDYILPAKMIKQKDFTVYGSIMDVELIREKEIIFMCRTDSVKVEEKVFKRSVNLICKIKDPSARKRDSLYSVLSPGYYISLSGTYSRGRDRRNPGEFDYNRYLNEKGISGTLSAYSSDNLKITGHQASVLNTTIFLTRKYIDNRLKALHDKETAGLLRGLILADRSDIDYDTKNNFVNTGVVHVLAVSGLHVAYISLIFMFLFGRFRPVVKSILILAGLFVYMLLTGATPSVVRATIMAAAVIIAYMFNRSTNVYNSLALSALVILVINPSDLFDAGFELSYVAVLSIALFYPVFKNYINSFENLNKWIKKFLLFVAVSLSAQTGTLPFTMAYFSRLSLSSLFANIVVIPLTGVQIAAALFTLFIDIFSANTAYLISGVNDLCTGILYWFVNYAGNLKYSSLIIRQFTLQDSLIYYTFILILFLLLKHVKYFWLKAACTAGGIVLVILLTALDNKELFPQDRLCVYMVDVGQGDAFLISFPGGKTALIDAGEATQYFDNGEKVIMPLLDFAGIDKIDYGFISHMDSDHYSGFVSLIHNKRLCKLFKPVPDTSKIIDKNFELFVKKEKIPLYYYCSRSFYIDGVKISFLNCEALQNQAGLTTNDRSAVIKIQYKGNSFLFTGDLSKKAEKYYLGEYGNQLKADVLKVSHHGSKTGSSEEFINTVHPEISLISAGIKNKFKLPSQVVLDRLKSCGSYIRRTDVESGVLYQSDGYKIKNINWKEMF